MKSNIIKIVGAALVGVSSGFAGGYYIGFKKGGRAAWKIADAEIEDQEDRLLKKYKLGQYNSENFFGFDPVEESKKMIDDVLEETLVGVSIDDLKKLQEHVESQGYAQGNIFDNFRNADGEEVSHETEDEIIEIIDNGVTPNMEDPEPYVITEAEFNHDMEDYEKVSLSFYPTDRVVADSRDQVVEDVESTLGVQSLAYFSEETRTVYVRNNRLEADFEIVLEPGSYAETVLGIAPEPIEERPRRKSRARPKASEGE